MQEQPVLYDRWVTIPPPKTARHRHYCRMAVTRGNWGTSIHVHIPPEAVMHMGITSDSFTAKVEIIRHKSGVREMRLSRTTTEPGHNFKRRPRHHSYRAVIDSLTLGIYSEHSTQIVAHRLEDDGTVVITLPAWS